MAAKEPKPAPEPVDLPHIPENVDNPPYVPPETPPTPVAGTDEPVSPGPQEMPEEPQRDKK